MNRLKEEFLIGFRKAWAQWWAPLGWVLRVFRSKK